MKRSSSANRFKHLVVKDWHILDVPDKAYENQGTYAKVVSELTFGCVVQDYSRKPDKTCDIVC